MKLRDESMNWIGRKCRFALLVAAAGAMTLMHVRAFGQVQVGSSLRGIRADTSWVISTSKFDNSFEAEPYIGNGYIGLRIPAAGMGYVGNLGRIGWPLGTERIASAIAAGVYAKTIDGTFYQERKEAIALIPNWSTLSFGDQSGVYSPATASATSIEGYHQKLELRSGTVETSGTWISPSGKKTQFIYRVAANRARGHVALVTLDLTPMWNGTAIVSNILDGRAARRVDILATGEYPGEETIFSTSRTKGTEIYVAESATLRSSCPISRSAQNSGTSESAEARVSFQAHYGQTCEFAKYVAVVSGRDSADPATDARTESEQAAKRGINSFRIENRKAWDTVWRAEIEVEGDPELQFAIRASEYALYSSISSSSPTSLGPSGLSSDGYAGTVFWDADTWMFPAILAQHPDLARVLVDYRSNTLPGARANAHDNGYAGALYPWTSAIAGDMGSECYGATTNPDGKVVSDPNKSCTQQFHLQSDIALAQWQYYEATGDVRWLAERGWPVLQAVAEFWSSKVTETSDDGYAITRVQTPDEYATDTDNDAYTNASAAQALQAAVKATGILGTPEPASWSRIASGLSHTILIDPVLKIHLEHSGYAGEQIKQADVVMLTYPLNASMPPEIGINDLNYYVPRTDINGPAMTDAIHSIAAASLNAPGCSAYTFMLRSYQPFLRKPFFQFSEFAPTQLSGTAYDFLTGVGGFMQAFLYGFTGLRYLDSAVFVGPNLPPQLAGLTLHDLVWRGRVFTIHVGPRDTTITLNSGSPLPIISDSGSTTIAPGSPLVLRTRRSDKLPTDNLSRCVSVTASSWLPGFPPVAAVDGSPATSWIAASPHATFTLRFANYVAVGGIQVIRGSSDPFSYSVQAPADGNHWRTVATAPASSNGVDDLIGFPPISVNTLKLVFDGSGTAKPPNIAEVIVLSPKR